MNFIKSSVFSILIPFVFFISSCDECQDCEPLDTNDPGVYVTFIDNTNIIKISGKLKDDKDELNQLSERLNEINLRLDEVGLTVEDSLDLQANKLIINAEIKEKNELIATEAAYLKELEEGQTTIDSLYIEGNPTFISFQKNSVFRFPLRPDRDSTTFIIIFNQRQDKLRFDYTRDIQVEGQRIKRIAKDIKIGKSTFLETESTNIINDTATVYY